MMPTSPLRLWAWAYQCLNVLFDCTIGMPINLFVSNVCPASDFLNAEATPMLMQWVSPLLELGPHQETLLTAPVEAES